MPSQSEIQAAVNLAVSGDIKSNGSKISGTQPAAIVPTEKSIDVKVEHAPTQCPLDMLNTNKNIGLTNQEAQTRLARFGPNALPEKLKNPCIEFLKHFWGVMPCMIWTAILIECILAFVTGENRNFINAGILFSLQTINGLVGWHEGAKADDAIAALKGSLCPKCSCTRDGKEMLDFNASQLVPGDIVLLSFGSAVPADCTILGDRDVSIDQAALTGESMPVKMTKGDTAKMGSVVSEGETKAIVVSTGSYTFFGRTAALINKASSETDHFQKVVWKITATLVGVSAVLVTVIFFFIVLSHESGKSQVTGSEKVLKALSICVVVLISAIPIAMQVVCITALAVGATKMAEKKAIVKRLGCIEELAGVRMLCSDKTGTLTTGKMVMQEPLTLLAFQKALKEKSDVKMGDVSGDDNVIQCALLAGMWMNEPKDAIDTMIFNSHEEIRHVLSDKFEQLSYEPFSPATKRTAGVVKKKQTQKIQTFIKGAPQVVLGASSMEEELRSVIQAKIESLAVRGVRTLAIARGDGSNVSEGSFKFIGLLTFLDPPRKDSASTIHSAHDMGILVKMITGDQANIAKDTALKLGLSDNILNASKLPSGDGNIPAGSVMSDLIMEASGFAEVFPEHKYMIVQAIRERGLLVAMTGDGVNDAPALKRADIGIAVEGATDAAVAAADIVLTEPGLSTVVDAILLARVIFQRMRSYVIYRIACTLQLVFVITIGTLTCNPRKYFPDGKDVDFFSLPVIALVLITVLNDGCIMTISYDNVRCSNKPQKWDLLIAVLISCVLAGTTLCLSLFLLFYSMENTPGSKSHGKEFFELFDVGPFYTYGEIQILMFLQIALSGFFTVYASRTKSFFWTVKPSYLLLLAGCVATSASTLLAVYWPFGDATSLANKGAGQGWKKAGLVWFFVLFTFLVQDTLKVLTYYALDHYHGTYNNHEKDNKVLKFHKVKKLLQNEKSPHKHHFKALNSEEKVKN